MTEGGLSGTSARFARAGALVLMTVLVIGALAPGAAAGEEDDALVTARAPVMVDGAGGARVDSGSLLVRSGATGERDVVTLELLAAELNVTVVSERADCPGGEDAVLPGGACFTSHANPSWTSARRFTLTDALVTAPGPVREDFLAAWTTDARHAESYDADAPGNLSMDHAGSGVGRLDEAHAMEEDRDAAEPSDPEPWTRSWTFTSHGDFAYDASGDLTLGARDGWARLALTGLDVRIRGTTPDGAKFDEVVRAGRTTDGSGGPGEGEWVRHVLLEAPALDALMSVEDARARAVGTFEVAAFDAVRLTDAEGVVTVGDRTYRFEGEDATVRGTLTLVPVAVEHESGDARLALRVTGSPVIVPAATPTEDAAPVQAGTAAAAAAGAIALAGVAYYWPFLRFASASLVMPLYSRIQKGDVLDHEKREQIFAMIKTEPGIHAHEIGARAGIGWGTTVYHLRMLEDHRLVTSKRVGRYRRFYTTAGASPNRKQAYAVLRNETSARVGEFVVKNPGCAQKEVCAALDLSPSLVSWHVNKLEEAELVKKVRQGRRVHYYAGPAWNEIDVKVVAPGLAGTPLSAFEPDASGETVAVAANGDN